ncbi:daunorubicin resistance protein [Limosilactobacillus frumenti DSM 13145]|uniref:UvrABC system protein A n=1 Tax=Limosilactobacillus frumenti DSM 13145 TaxID=1423746 RepID=A0A0R1PE82_9LACO|nr:excinuclease ABC subunit UvrA [Limosilactobacillus frumenti]KRL27251.1 daunorubicin resistance protein [Limosilactobacillus frumenti DSM 13145]QFG72704.1 excinuclease ABC subunit UvrA [Limosilactobacillus frumenti]
MTEYITVHGAKQNNLKNINVKIPKHQITVFVGLSGSGKSSLVFDTIAAASRRELNATFPSFTQQYLPKYGEPAVDTIDNLPVAIVVEQKRLSSNARSTLATYTGIYSLVRLLFSRVGKPFVGYSNSFSFNLPQGMCPHCQGLGYVDDIDEQQLIDPNKSLNQGAIQFVSFGVNTWRWRRYTQSGLFDNDKPIKDYSPHEYELLMHSPQIKLKNPPKEWHKTALYEGIVPRIRRSILYSAEGKHHRQAIAQLVTRRPCPVCHGARLNHKALTNHIHGKNIAEFSHLDLVHALQFLQAIQDPLSQNIVHELTVKLQSLIDIGLGYLTLDRSTGTLSGGEAQRIKIAKYLTSSLTDMLYVFDEPSVGLHPHDIELIKRALLRLKKQGNTIMIVEHNPAMIALADHVIEIGPAAGQHGGQVTFSGSYPDLMSSETLTGKWLRKHYPLKKPRQASKWLRLRHVVQNNLHNVSVNIPLGVMTVVTGVAGSGKSSLLTAIKHQLAGHYIDLTQTALTGNIRSTPATYVEILNIIRRRFAKANSVSTQYFTYNGKKGACPMCKGKGVTITNMAFMDPIVQRCELCHGQRYNDQALSYRYHGKNIAEVLGMSVEHACRFFADDQEISKPLQNLAAVGLEYLSLDQPLSTLSGGELQRLKLAYELNQTGQVYIFDEPTAGLHPQNIERLLKLFNSLVEAGNTLILIEHNLTVMTQADYLVDVGPDAGIYGGHIQFAGTPHELVNGKVNTYTATALRHYLE